MKNTQIWAAQSFGYSLKVILRILVDVKPRGQEAARPSPRTRPCAAVAMNVIPTLF